MQEGAAVDHYARHEEHFKKRRAFLRESLDLVEQRRRLTRKKPPSEAFKRIILRLKQSQADVEAVKGKNQKLLQAVDDILMQKQAHVLIKPNISDTGDKITSWKEPCWEESLSQKENMLDNTSSTFFQEEKGMINACNFDIQEQHQATSHIKLQDLGSASKRFSTDASALLPITSTTLCQEVTLRTSKKTAQHDSRDLQGCIHHKTSMLAERLALQPVSLETMAPSASTSVQEIGYGRLVQYNPIDSNRVCTPENTNKLTLACSSIHGLEDDCNKRNTQATSNSNSREQDSELIVYPHKRNLEQEEQSIKPSFSSCTKLERIEATTARDGAPIRFLVNSESHVQTSIRFL